MAKPGSLTIPTEPIGSIPRPLDFIERVARGDSEDPDFAPLYEDAIRDTIERFEATGSPVVTDGEQRKHHNFATYCVHGLRSRAGQAGGDFAFGLESDVSGRDDSGLFTRAIHRRSPERA